MNPQNLTDQNSTQNSDSNSNESLWLSDSYNLLHHNGRIRRDQPQSSNISLINSEQSDSQTSVNGGENDHYQIDEARETETEITPILKRGEPNSDSRISLVKPKLIDRAAKPSTARATPNVHLESHHQLHSHTYRHEGARERERQSTPYPDIDLADIDDDDEKLSSHHLLQMGKISCQNNLTSPPHSSSKANELTHTQSMEELQGENFEFAPQSNRTSTPYPDEQFYASDDSSEY